MRTALLIALGIILLHSSVAVATGGGGGHGADINFPPSLASYEDGHLDGIGDTLSHRMSVAPFNLAATALFLCAIIHTFLTSKFLEVSHRWEHDHHEKIERGERPKGSVHFGAVVAGAVTGGGLTVIANAPNPAGQSILKRYFDHGVSPIGLVKAALLPTVIMALCFWLLRF